MTQYIEYIDQDICDQIMTVLEKEMQKLLKGYNLNVARKGTAIYSDNNIQGKFEISLINKQGMVLNRRVSDFPLYASKYGLDPADLGRTFKHEDRKYKITGLNTRASRLPICVVGLDNSQPYKFTAKIVCEALYGKKSYDIRQTY